jgi:hypothetical protein
MGVGKLLDVMNRNTREKKEVLTQYFAAEHRAGRKIGRPPAKLSPAAELFTTSLRLACAGRFARS